MIRFESKPEPTDFDDCVRRPGLQWLKSHAPSEKPYPYWHSAKPDLAAAFDYLCGYSVMFEPVGTVDHYLSIQNHRELAYEWHNYRFAAGWINSSKQNADQDIFDPFEVEDGWFEIILPSLQLTLSDMIPDTCRAKAAYTLERLHLRDDERVIRQRREWYRMYENGELTLEGLRKKAPLIARAVERLEIDML